MYLPNPRTVPKNSNGPALKIQRDIKLKELTEIPTNIKFRFDCVNKVYPSGAKAA